MTRNTTLRWKLGLSVFSLSAAISVYCFTRLYPPELLARFQIMIPDLSAQAGIFGSAPSFFYTLALGLLIGSCASSTAGARFHCLLWIAVALCLELVQHRLIAEPLVAWLRERLSEPIWELVGPYWTRGTFDRLDLLASIIGGSIALLILTYRSGEKNHEK